jgi:hypothetical protein
VTHFNKEMFVKFTFCEAGCPAKSKFCLVYIFKAPFPNSNIKPKVKIKKKINNIINP